ncbi:hypothetical protein ARMSODRAFT_456690 [Armillaria solidipes]|uniref:Uncharacterized protein n=1 Tax=Armillaria solidipes TaxID=1076256 RepID=A0A2H3BC78_9AGAR|nr:hypothetical protein ARMSODRAFT_456690 [Armillaria solidipes]
MSSWKGPSRQDCGHPEFICFVRNFFCQSSPNKEMQALLPRGLCLTVYTGRFNYSANICTGQHRYNIRQFVHGILYLCTTPSLEALRSSMQTNAYK